MLSSSSFTIEKPKRSPQGRFCLCSSCPCLPSLTSGSFHWEKDAGWGAALQIPPGCGICNKQPRGTSAALSLLTAGASPQVPLQAPQTTTDSCLDLCHLNSYARCGKHTTRTLRFNLFSRLFKRALHFFDSTWGRQYRYSGNYQPRWCHISSLSAKWPCFHGACLCLQWRAMAEPFLLRRDLA